MYIWETEQKCTSCLRAPIKENVCEFLCVLVHHISGRTKKKMRRERRMGQKSWQREFMEKELLLSNHEMEMSVIIYSCTV